MTHDDPFLSFEMPWGVELVCKKCNSNTVEWIDCWNCGGMGAFDLHEEDPLYYDPETYEQCSICEGDEGWNVCTICHPEEQQ